MQTRQRTEWRQVARDPFARATLYRRREYVDADRSCDWCGSVARTPSGRLRLYRFKWEGDGVMARTAYGDKHLFCARSCRDAFYGA